MLKYLEMSLQEIDKNNIWHPLTQHQTSAAPIAIVKAKGSILTDDSGNTYIDAIASWYTAMYGHCNPKIVAAVTEQMQQLDQIVFTGFTHKPAIELSEKLLALLPQNFKKIFFNDNGSTAVDAAIKMAFQFFHNKGIEKTTIIAFEDGFHGDTFGAMSASDLSVYNGPFQNLFIDVVRIPVPHNNNIEIVTQQLKTILETKKCAAFIYEPLVQGAAGMKFHSAEGLNKLLEVCKQYKVLCIADEVMTGFGKTGPNFASSLLKEQPDIMCLSKALTAGMLPMSITACTEEVFNGFLDTKLEKGFFHAHTYSANPPACAAAIAGIELLMDPDILDKRTKIANKHKDFVTRLEKHSNVENVRSKGVILAFELSVEMERYGALRNKLFSFFMSRGVFLRPLGNTLYIVPPFTITDEELEKIYESLEAVLDLVK